MTDQGSDERISDDDRDPAMRCIDATGPWPFLTRKVFANADGTEWLWSSRHHRKGLVVPQGTKATAKTTTLLRCLWMPQQLNWWIGTIFALGSLLFALASVLSLAPALTRAWSLDSTGINAIFFAGSIPFTIAAWLQLYQAANAGEYDAREKGSGLFSAKHPSGRSGKRDPTPLPRARSVLFGWRPHDIGWLSSALQFVGTILFNINTFDAMLPGLDWLQQDLIIWAPDFVGSILFLASGYLAYIETCHRYWAWNPTSISWWVVFSNLLGCIGFMIAAIFSLVLPGPANGDAVTISIVFTLLGAIGFYIGSVLMLPETISQGNDG